MHYLRSGPLRLGGSHYEGFGVDASTVAGAAVAKAAGGVDTQAILSKLPDAASLGARLKDLKEQAGAIDGMVEISKGYNVAKDKLFEYGYATGRQLLSYVNSIPQVARFTAASNQLVTSTSAMVAAAKSDQWDAGGIIDKTTSFVAWTGAIGSFLDAVGVNTTVGSVVREIGAWGGVTGGCAAGVMTAGPYIGAIACAFSVVTKLFSMIGGGGYVRPNVNTTWATFHPNQENAPWVQTDAMRLASVLRFHYGFTSTSQLVSRFKAYPYLATYPDRPVKMPTDTAQPGAPQMDRPIPAVDLRVLITALNAFYAGGAIDDPNADLDVLALVRVGDYSATYEHGYYLGDRSGFKPQLDYPGRMRIEDLGPILAFEHKINVAAIETGAAAARACIGNREKISGQSPDIQGTSNACDGTLPGKGGVSLGMLRVDELLNFFASVTISEIRSGQDPVDAYVGSGLAVRSTQVPAEINNQCWTTLRIPDNLDCAGSVVAVSSQHPGWSLAQRVREEALSGRSYGALKEFAALRLMAAASQLLMYYQWGTGATSATGTPTDPIAGIQVPPYGTVDWAVQAPTDPRQALLNGAWVELAPEEVHTVDHAPALTALPRGDSGDEQEKVLSWLSTIPRPWFGKQGRTDLRSALPQAVKDPWFLYNATVRRNAEMGRIMAAARAAAAQDHQTVVAYMTAATLNWNPNAPSGNTSSAPVSGRAANLSANPLVGAISASSRILSSMTSTVQAQDECAAQGGVPYEITEAGVVRQYCRPTPEARARLDAACQAQGYVPVWVKTSDSPDAPEQMRCLPRSQAAGMSSIPASTTPAAGGGVMVPLALGAAALLAIKFLK